MKGARAPVDETVAEFVRRRLGHEALERLVDPLVAGIFAGDPEQLSLHAAFPKMAALEARYGGVLRGAMQRGRGWQARAIRGFRAGMATLPRAIASRLGTAVQTNTFVTELGRNADGTFRGAARSGANGRVWHARHVVIATPADVAATLLQPICPAAVEPLRDITYAPVVVAHVAYPRAACPQPLNGFGFLVPQRAAVRLLGALWTSSCFPDRAPSDTVLCTLFYGGMRDPEMIDVGDDALRATIAADVRATMGIASAPLHCQLTRHRAAIPQYTVGHSARVARIVEALATIPGLHLSGNYFTGTSVNDTIAHATGVAQKVLGTVR